jgi:hypothetical protein
VPPIVVICVAVTRPPFKRIREFRIIPEWITGMAVVRGAPAA